MATISISEQLSGVTIHSTATITEKSRSGTSVVLNVGFSSYLNSSGFIGTGYSVKGTITAYNGSKDFTLKSSSASWSGTTKHTTSGTMTITVPATVTSIALKFKLAFDGESASKSSTLTISKVLASVTSATAFSDTTNPTMNFSNPGGFKIRPYLNVYDKSGGTRLLQLRPNGMSETGASLSSPYVWSLTEEQRNQIRNALGTKTTAYVAVGLETYNGSTYLGYSSKGVTFTNNLAPPIFTDFSYEDIGGQTIDENISTLDLTGNNQKIIKGYSKLKILINTPTEAQKGATMSHYLINGIQYTYADSFEVEIDKWTTEKITIYAVDSRGVSKEVSKTCDLINYSPLGKGAISVKREGNIGVQTTLSYDGLFWNNNFGIEENLIQASYKFRKTSDSSYIEGITTINPTTSENKFNFEDYIFGDSSENGFEINDSYEIVVNVKDKLSEITYSSILGSGIPALAIYKNNVAIHGKYDKELGGTQIYGDAYLDGTPIETKTEQKILWQGGMYMISSHTANLNEKISKQKNGIVLVFSDYSTTDSAPNDYHFNMQFIPKQFVKQHNGKGVSIFLIGASIFEPLGSKYLYVHDDYIKGNDNNKLTGTKNGVTYANNRFVLRYVIGV